MRKIIFLGIILILIILIFWSYGPFEAGFYKLADYFKVVSEKNEQLAGLTFFGLSALSAMFAPLSSVPLVPFASIIWGDTTTFILLFSGWLAGGIVTYMIGRIAGYPIVKKLVFFDRIQEYRNHLTPKSEFSLVLLFRLAMPAEIPGYLLGILKYNFGKYMVATFLGELPVAIITVFIAEAVIQKKIILSIALLLALISILIITSAALVKKKKQIKKTEV